MIWDLYEAARDAVVIFGFVGVLLLLVTSEPARVFVVSYLN